MWRVTIVFGVLLVLLGIAGYWYAASESAEPSKTALIPAGVGLPLVLLGALSAKENLRKHTMHAAALLGVLGFLGGVFSILMPLFKNSGLALTVSLGTKLAMSLLCLAFVGLCVNSFIQVRRSRRAAGQ